MREHKALVRRQRASYRLVINKNSTRHLMLSSLKIKNFKSIVDLTLDLGRFNMLIGENGCGKTNILEALGMATSDELTNEDLFQRGLRVALQ
jgi:ABC-type lipoprotein export system ATPase subunit